MRIEGVYINLDRSTERRGEMERQFGRFAPGYPVRRLKAVDGNELKAFPPQLRPAQYAVWLSHLEALAASPGADCHVHIMEDDVEFSSAVGILPDLIASLDAGSGGNWDILYLDATLIEPGDMCRVYGWTRSAREDGRVRICPLTPEFTVYGLHSYIVNGARKAKLRDYLNRHLASGKPLDNATAHGIQSGQLQCFVTTPYVTTASETSLARTWGEMEDRFVAWHVFRRLCFYDLDPAQLADLQQKNARLAGALSDEDRVLGELCAYRMARWPTGQFGPGMKDPD